MKLNRHQNHLQLLAVNANTGESRLMLEEINKYYVDIHDNLQFWKMERNFYGPLKKMVTIQYISTVQMARNCSN